MSENFSGGDISLICRRASMEALKRNENNFALNFSDFEKAFDIIKK